MGKTGWIFSELQFYFQIEVGGIFLLQVMQYIVKCARYTSMLKIKYDSSKKCLAGDIRRSALVFPAEEGMRIAG